MHAELATEDATVAVAELASDCQPIATDENSGPSVEGPASSATNTLVATEDAIESKTETQTAVSGVATTEATAIVTTEPDTAAHAPDAANAGVALANVDDISGDAKVSGDKSSNDKVVSLADRRKAKPSASPARRRAMAVVASILVTATATVGLHELMQSELGQRMLELGTCDGNMLSATRDCSLLSWLMI